MKTNKASSLRQYVPAALTLAVIGVLYLARPAQGAAVGQTAWGYFLEMVAILPAVLLLMGVFEVWIPKNMIQKYLGKQSGFSGYLLALFFGTLPTGPLYIAFPIAAGLLEKGARITNVIVFLGAWAAAKIPQIMVEAKFLGIKFAMLRLVLTIVTITITGYLIEMAEVKWKITRTVAGATPGIDR